MKNSLKNIAVLFALIIFMGGCTSIFTPKETPEYTRLDQKRVSELNRIHNKLNEMHGVDVALYLERADVSTLLNDSFDPFFKYFIAAHAQTFSSLSLAQVRLYLAEQSMVSKISFSFTVEELDIKVRGHLKAKHDIHVGTDEFRLKTLFDEIVIKSIKGKNELDLSKDDRTLITSKVKALMQRLNVEIISKPLGIPVDINILSHIDEKNILKSESKWHAMKKLAFHTKMHTFVPYISHKGIVFLGASENKIIVRQILEMDDLQSLSDAVKTEINEALDESIGISLDTLQRDSSYHVSKAYVSKQMNKELREIDMRSMHSFLIEGDKKDRLFSKEIRFKGKNNLPSCQRAELDCGAMLKTCKGGCEENYGAHKCVQCAEISNPFEKVRCLSQLEGCKTQEALRLYKCKKEENSCEANNARIYEKCKMDNTVLVKTCKKRKEELLFVDDEILLAKLLVHFDLVNVYGVQRVRGISFNEELDSLEIERDVHLSVKSRSRLSLAEIKSEEIRCKLNFEEPVLTHSKVDYLKLRRASPILVQKLEDGKLNIKADVKARVLQAKLENTPYEKMFINKETALHCEFLNMAMTPVKGEALLRADELPRELILMRGETELEFQEEELSFFILPVKIGKEMSFYPALKSKSIRFKR